MKTRIIAILALIILCPEWAWGAVLVKKLVSIDRSPMYLADGNATGRSTAVMK